MFRLSRKNVVPVFISIYLDSFQVERPEWPIKMGIQIPTNVTYVKCHVKVGYHGAAAARSSCGKEKSYPKSGK